ncbi:unnamed protein product [Paramecium sonneborni]|uniref:Uncharacterized protein n=1 Tax=Paramecium sonneborni TaxID=65129 RepID=A0A8S1LBM1_9CILI|nr:unnamed protein product [Paramecium sonneborni]
MQINSCLTSDDKYSEFNIEMEAAQIASRIIEKVLQKSNVKSDQRLLVKQQNFRSSDYKPKPQEIQSFRKGTTSITERYELNLEQNFNQINSLKNYYASENNLIETIKTHQRSQLKSASTGIQDIYQKTVKLNGNNFYVPEHQSQSTTDKLDSTKLIKLTNSVNTIINKKSDQLLKLRRIDSNTQFEFQSIAKLNQLQTPVKSNQEDIVSQLLGSLPKNKKYYDNKNSVKK